MDQSSGRVLSSNNAYKKGLIASTTKIMTAIVAIEYGDLNDYVTVDKSILESNGSSIYLDVGEKIKLVDLIYGLMLRSGNDAALAIANHVGGSVDDFVGLMNNKALDIGMKDTLFINPHGLENNTGAGNISTCYDLAVLMRYAMNNKIFANITSTKKYLAKSSLKKYTWQNKNKLLFNYKYTTGGKTGYTKKAHRILVTSANKDNKKLIIVTFDYSDDFDFHKRMYNEFFEKYFMVKVYDKNSMFFNKMKYSDGQVMPKDDYYALLNKSEYKFLKAELVSYQYDKSDNKSIVGKVNIYLKDEIIHSDFLYINHYPKRLL